MYQTQSLIHKLSPIALAFLSITACKGSQSESVDGQTTTVASASTPACTVVVDSAIYNDKYVPETQVLVSNFSLSAGMSQNDDGSYIALTTEVKNKTANQVVATNDEAIGRFPPDLDSQSPLVDGKRKISASVYRPNTSPSSFYSLGFSDCAPGGTIKLSELKPLYAGSKVCTIEVDAIPPGFTTWDEAINMNEMTFALNFGVKLKQVNASSQVTIGDKLDVYKFTNRDVQATDNKYTMTIGHLSADCTVGGTVNISTFH